MFNERKKVWNQLKYAAAKTNKANIHLDTPRCCKTQVCRSFICGRLILTAVC